MFFIKVKIFNEKVKIKNKNEDINGKKIKRRESIICSNSAGRNLSAIIHLIQLKLHFHKYLI